MRIKEVAEHFSVSVATIYKWIKKGFPVISKPNCINYFDIDKCKKWHNENVIRMTNKQKIDILNISIASYYLYKAEGMPDDLEEAKSWILGKKAACHTKKYMDKIQGE